MGYLKKIPELIPYYIESLSKDNWIYLVTKQVCYVSAFPEIIESFISVLGGNLRCQKLYKITNIKLLYNFDKIYSIGVRNSSAKYFNAIANFTNKFVENKGFDFICSLIDYTFRIKKKDSKIVNWNLPFQLLVGLLKASYFLLRNIVSNYREEFAKKILKSVGALFERFTEEDYIINDIHMVFVCIESYYMLHVEFDNQDHTRYEIMFDNLKLKTLIGFLKCPVFEKKLYSISKLSELRENKNMETRNNLRRQALLESNITEILFGAQYHEEIVRRCPKFLVFLAPSLTSQNLSEILINSFQHSNEKSSSVCECFGELIKNVNYDTLFSIFQACKEIPDNKINMKLIALIKDILSRTIMFNKFGTNDHAESTATIQNSYNKSQADKLSMSCIMFLWSLVQDNTKVPSAVIKEVFRSLKTDLLSSNFKNEREDFMEIIATSVKNIENVTQAILLLKGYLKIYAVKSISAFPKLSKNGSTSFEEIIKKIGQEKSF